MEDFWKKTARGKENIRFVQSKSFSPYSEFSRNWCSESDGITSLTMNGFYRYDTILEPLFGNTGISEERKNWLFDIYMHYLTDIEYLKGMTLQECKIRQYMQELKSGLYGKELQIVYGSLDQDRQYYIAHAICMQDKTQESVRLFCDVLIYVMQDGVVYRNKTNTKELLYYINLKQTKEDAERVEMIRKLFLPLGYELRVFWAHHFAVIGYEQTSQLGEIELI